MHTLDPALTVLLSVLIVLSYPLKELGCLSVDINDILLTARVCCPLDYTRL